MVNTRQLDREMLENLPKEQLIDLIFLQMRNLWSVDGLYYIGIEEEYGTDAATEIDVRIWKIMGKIEARRIKNTFDIMGSREMEYDIPGFVKALRLTSWALDLEFKDFETGEGRAVLRNTDCRIQNTRLSKGLAVFPCKNVRLGFLEAFANEINPNIRVECVTCPPDEHPGAYWCRWEFIDNR